MQKRSPLVEGEFLEIHRSKLELDPCGDRGQPSIWSITHCVFLFGVRKDALNRLRTQGIPAVVHRRSREPWLITMHLESWINEGRT